MRVKNAGLEKGVTLKDITWKKIEIRNTTSFANQVFDSSFSSGGDENNESDTWPAKMEH